VEISCQSWKDGNIYFSFIDLTAPVPSSRATPEEYPKDSTGQAGQAYGRWFYWTGLTRFLGFFWPFSVP
jgi:hypothetical protein